MQPELRPSISARLSSVLAVALLLSVSAPAAAEDSKWHLRLFGTYVDADIDEIDSDGDTSATGDSAAGLGVSLEYRFSRRIGVELGALTATPDLSILQTEDGGVLAVSDGLRTTPIYAALNLHLTPDRRFDFYVGPLIAQVSYDDLVFNIEPGLVARLESDTDFAFGLGLGFDTALGKSSWTFGASAKYLDSTFDTRVAGDTERIEIDVDPLILSAGVGYRF